MKMAIDCARISRFKLLEREAFAVLIVSTSNAVADPWNLTSRSFFYETFTVGSIPSCRHITHNGHNVCQVTLATSFRSSLARIPSATATSSGASFLRYFSLDRPIDLKKSMQKPRNCGFPTVCHRILLVHSPPKGLDSV